MRAASVWLLVAAAALHGAHAIACPWPEVAGDRLLDRKIGTLSLPREDLESALAAVEERGNVPLSFIQGDRFDTVQLALPDATVRQALDAVVQQAPAYRYEVRGGRLVLYPRDPFWTQRIENISLGPGPRVKINRQLVVELAHRVPELATLSGPWVMGNSLSYTYTDAVKVQGPASILDLMLQLLGDRPESYLIFFRRSASQRPSLSVSSRDQIQSLRASAPVTTLRRAGEMTQLKVAAILGDGTSKELAAGACATLYSVSDEKVLSVSPDGLVTARGNGTADVTITNEHTSTYIRLTVSIPKLKEAPLGAPPGARAEVAPSIPEPPALGEPDCPWPELSGHRLLGNSFWISAAFTVSNPGQASAGLLQVAIADLVKSLSVTSPKAVLRQVGEAVQLHVTGVLRDGATQNLTPATCGTRYFSTSDALRVNHDGSVTAAAGGHGGIVVGYDNMGKSIFLDVIPAGPSRGGPNGAR